VELASALLWRIFRVGGVVVGAGREGACGELEVCCCSKMGGWDLSGWGKEQALTCSVSCRRSI
jgi:hypothetical protein